MSSYLNKNVSITDNAISRDISDNRNMPTRIHNKNRRPTRVYLKEWIDFRGLTGEQLAGRLETSKSVISKLMTGKQRYNHDWMEMIAFALNCEVPDLYRDPNAPTSDELLAAGTPDELRQAIKLIQDLRKTGTDG